MYLHADLLIKLYLYLLKKKIIKNVIRSEDTLMHKPERRSNFFPIFFTHNQAEQIKKEVICVQVLLETQLT